MQIKLKKILLLAFVFLLFSTAVVVGFVGLVTAEGTIYIRSDGSIEGTDKIQRDGDIYTLIGNITGYINAIVIQINNVTLDGAGYTIQGIGATLSKGIDLSYRSNVTVKNVEIRDFRYGIYLNNSLNNIVTGNNITNNLWGIRIGGSNNSVSENEITNNGYGIWLQEHSNNVIGNKIVDNGHGIWLYGSSNSIIGNYIANNGNGTYICTIPFGPGSSNNIIYHNSFVNNTKQIDGEKGFAIPVSINIWDDGVEGNYWSDYEDRYPNARELNGSGIWNTSYVIDENNQDNYPLVSPGAIPEFPDITPPSISIVSPENKTYTVSNVSLTFIVSEPTSWIGYSLGAQVNVTIAGNTTLTGLSDGTHNLTVYAKDTAGNTGTSETIYFTIKTKKAEPFPTTWIVAAIVIIAIVGVALLVYFAKIRKTTEKAE